MGGATSSSFTPPTVTAGTTYYYVEVTGTCGTIASNTAQVIVNASTDITTDPTGAIYCQNGTATALSVTATGTGTLTYQWFSNTVNNNTSGTAVGGATSSSFTPPTVTAGTTYYYVEVTGTCGTIASNTSNITVTATNTAGTPSSSPTVCINTAITPSITHTTTGATGISSSGVSGANGLPAGVSATWAGNTITISGTPTASGTFAYSILLTGGCGTVNATGTIIVTANNTVTAGSTTTLCISSSHTKYYSYNNRSNRYFKQWRIRSERITGRPICYMGSQYNYDQRNADGLRNICLQYSINRWLRNCKCYGYDHSYCKQYSNSRKYYNTLYQYCNFTKYYSYNNGGNRYFKQWRIRSERITGRCVCYMGRQYNHY